MEKIRILSQDEYKQYEEWLSTNKDKLIFDYEDGFRDEDGGRIAVKIFRVSNKVIGLTRTYQAERGWKSWGDNAIDLVYDAISRHENEFVRRSITDFWSTRTNRNTVDKSIHSIPYSVLKKMVGDESVIVRVSVADCDVVTREILDLLAEDPEEKVRGAVARNPLTSQSTLRRLSEDKSLVVLEALASNASASSSILIAMNDNKSVRDALARNPATPPAILWDIYKDLGGKSAIREAISSNPNAPRDLLMEIARGYYSTRVFVNLAKNRSTPQEAIILLAERTAGTSVVVSDWPKALLDSPLLPVSYYEKFADTTNASIRRWVRDNPRAPEPLRTRLSYNPDLFRIDKYISEPEKPRFPETNGSKSLVEIYSLSQKGKDRALAASSPNATREILERLALDHDISVKVAVAENRFTDEDLLLLLCDDDDAKVRRAIAGNPFTTDKIVEKLRIDENESVRAQLAKRADIPTSILSQFALSDSVEVRYAVAGNESLPYAFARNLLFDDYAAVRCRAAARNDLLESDCKILMESELSYCKTGAASPVGPSWDTIATLMGKIDLAVKLQEELLQFNNVAVKSRLAVMPGAALPILNRLAEDSSYHVRSALASRSRLPRQIQEKLVNDENGSVRGSLAKNPHLCQMVVARLVEEGSGWTSRDAIRNPSIDCALLIEKAMHGTEWDRASAAGNPMLPNWALERLSCDASELVREAAAANLNLSCKDAERLSEDCSEIVRASIAKSKKLPTEALVRLAKDESIRVTGALASRDDLSDEVLAEIVQWRPRYAVGLFLRYGKTFGVELSEVVEAVENVPRKETHFLAGLAKCEKVPAAVLKRLFDIGSEDVRANLVGNQNMPYVDIEPGWDPDSSSNHELEYDDDIPWDDDIPYDDDIPW